jgi:hypothetical protein
MKKFIIINAMLLFSITFNAFGQSIPYGQSSDTMSMPDGLDWTIGYYKPLNYDSLNSEIILYCHGQGGDASEGYNLLYEIADK